MLWYGVIQGLVLNGLLVAMPSMAEPLSSMDACLLKKLRQSGSGLSVGQIKEECEAVVQQVVDSSEATGKAAEALLESSETAESVELVAPVETVEQAVSVEVVDKSFESDEKADLIEAAELVDSEETIDELQDSAESVDVDETAEAVEVVERSVEKVEAAEIAGDKSAEPVESIEQAEQGESSESFESMAVDVEPVESVAPAKLDEPTSPSLISQRLQAEKATRFNPFVLSPHKRNYVLLASYNTTPNYEIYNLPASDFDRIEMKFQLSFKIPVYEGMFGSDADLYVAYTNLSFWQAYNRHISSPFRETVHEPELMVVMPSDWSMFGWKNSMIQFGLVHQSNGQGGYLSRSWNRFYGNFIFEKDNYLISFRPWARIPESDDDNPDITDYLGHYELRGIYKHGDQTFSLMLRNLLENSGSETFMLDWSFPMYRRWRGYVQYFNGYGESLIDYNAKSNRIGFGVQLTDWL